MRRCWMGEVLVGGRGFVLVFVDECVFKLLVGFVVFFIL